MKYIVGNWKMNLDIKDSISLARGIVACVEKKDISPQIIICPTYVALDEVSKTIEGSTLELGAQNCGPAIKGAFTGEVSPAVLKGLGCAYAIVGHSERRNIFNESNKIVRSRLEVAIKNNLVPILCVGESKQDRESGNEENYIIEQLESALSELNISKNHPLFIAYEPVWAIGTQDVASISEILKMHTFIREMVKKFTNLADTNIKILYGGSVKKENAFSFLRESEVDGVLIGGASLDKEEFNNIIKVAADIIAVQQ